MKTIIIALLMGWATTGYSAEVGSNMAAETGLAYSNTFDFHAGADGTRRIGATVTYTSTTFTAKTFTDGRTSSGTITVISTTGILGQYVSVNGYQFCVGDASYCPVDNVTKFAFPLGATVTDTAHNLITKIAATSAITGVTATHTLGVANLVSVASDGIAYAVTTSIPSKISISGNMGDGAVAKVSAITDNITIASHKFTTGLKVGLSGSNLPSPFTATDYYVLKVDANNIKLSTTQADAIAGTFINILSVPATASANTYTLTAAGITGTPSFKWQASNDSVYWADLAVSSVTMSGYTLGGTTSIWDMAWYPYKWLRLNVVGPTTGGIFLKADLSVKN